MGNMTRGLITLFRKARLEQHMTQQEVADQIGISANAYGKIELGTRGLSSDLIGPLCKILHIPPHEAISVMVHGKTDTKTEEHAISFPDTGNDNDDPWGFPDHGFTVMFRPDEYEIHTQIAAFLGVAPESNEAINASDYIIYLRRRREAFRNQETRKENEQNDRSEQNNEKPRHAQPDGPLHGREHLEKP